MTRLQGIRILGAAAAAVAAALFATLAWAVASGAAGPWDEAIRSTTHASASESMTWLAFALSLVGSAPVWLSIAVAAGMFFWRFGWRHAAVDLAAVMIGASLLESGLKLAFGRARPEVYFGVAPLTYSFPSGHALFAACLYGALACLIAARIQDRVIGALLWIDAALLAIAIGISRVYIGVHYPSDVVAGYLVAVFWIGLVTAFRASDEK